mmetsp:Transcript_47680/g.138917  ORF Transcript_47680/g.138917 Transcript_47680/m.138917 type:complete len:251 (-) Transcript_47680:518-1270(-)
MGIAWFLGRAEGHVPACQGHLRHQHVVGALAEAGGLRSPRQPLALELEPGVGVSRDGSVHRAQRHAERLPAPSIPMCGARRRAQYLVSLAVGHIHHDATVVCAGAAPARAPDRREGVGLSALGHIFHAKLRQRPAGACEYAHGRQRGVLWKQLFELIAIVEFLLQDPVASMEHVLQHVDSHAALLDDILGDQCDRLIHDRRHRKPLVQARLDELPFVFHLKVLAVRRQRGHRRQPAVQPPQLQPISWCEQ